MATGGWAVTEAGAEFAIVLCTASPGGSEKIAKALVEERLAACVNVSQVRSYFFWKGKSCDEKEELMIIKTVMKLVERIKARIKELHSYELPEIIIIPIVGGDERYLQWIAQSIG
ncbi:Divalent-cation tolerance protein CutA [uncultured archaeon]|nr:Divalent-cation tolerance protein CutA [uncultured archaeon]